jgi:predicted nucleic acid-binding protein
MVLPTVVALSRLLTVCRVEGVTEHQARSIGSLIAHCGLVDTVDVAVAEGAIRRGDAVVTSNRKHIARVADVAHRRLAIHDV